MRSVEACLRAAQADRRSTGDARDLLCAAVDELERIVCRIYRPGERLPRSLASPDAPDGDLPDHVDAASALLTAYAVTGRLPYSMLAEELIQLAKRTWWVEEQGTWTRNLEVESPKAEVKSPKAEVHSLEAEVECLNVSCGAARVLCRLAALHQDDDYRRAAVTAVRSDYARDAERTLASLASTYHELGLGAARYGVALCEWKALAEMSRLKPESHPCPPSERP
jgi:uncharacterized protein YyaL (SSP411 family)